jgi:hypothetical protein
LLNCSINWIESIFMFFSIVYCHKIVNLLSGKPGIIEHGAESSGQRAWSRGHRAEGMEQRAQRQRYWMLDSGY